MNRKERLYKIADETGEDIYNMIGAALLPMEEWEPAVIGNGKDGVYMVVSENFGGMVMVARWVNAKSISYITSDDIADMIVGSDGQTKN